MRRAGYLAGSDGIEKFIYPWSLLQSIYVEDYNK
jgi:hypothetical protein